jgi:formylglycine-generating enzyme required for sulfatase activity
MDRYEVSAALWTAVRNWALTNGYSDLPAGVATGVNHPVTHLSWHDAVKWCNARSQRAGRTPVYCTDVDRAAAYTNGIVDLTAAHVRWDADGYRLPTEAEWERAARGGWTGYRFPWGERGTNIPPRRYQANFLSSGDPFELGTTPVGYFNGAHAVPDVAHPHLGTPPDMANAYGLYDMAGNVREFCWDFHDAAFYAHSPSENPCGPDTGTAPVARGGGFESPGPELRCAARGSVSNRHATAADLGFRTVRRPFQD